MFNRLLIIIKKPQKLGIMLGNENHEIVFNRWETPQYDSILVISYYILNF